MREFQAHTGPDSLGAHLKRTPSYDEAAERSLLGAVLIDPPALGAVREVVADPDEFGGPKHRAIYAAMLALADRGEAIDEVTVADELRKSSMLDASGGIAYLAELAASTPTSANVGAYGRIVHERAVQRRMVAAAVAIAEEGQRGDGDVSDYTSRALSVVTQLAVAAERRSPLSGVTALKSLGQTQWLDRTPPERDVLLYVRNEDGSESPFMAKGVTGALVGAGGFGKTFMLTQLGVALATGDYWLGCMRAPQPRKVLLVLGEEDDDEMHRRIQTTARPLLEEGFPEKEAMLRDNLFPLALRGHDCSLLDGDHRETEFYRSLKRVLCNSGHAWDCVIIDPAARFTGPETELDSKAATHWVNCLERLCMQVPGKPFLLAGMHTNKTQGLSGAASNQGAARGTSGITDGLRWQCNVERVTKKEKGRDAVYVKNRVRLRPVKVNYIKDMDAIELIRRDGGRIDMARPDELLEDGGVAPQTSAANDSRELQKEIIKRLMGESVPVGVDTLRRDLGRGAHTVKSKLAEMAASGLARHTRAGRYEGWMVRGSPAWSRLAEPSHADDDNRRGDA